MSQWVSESVSQWVREQMGRREEEAEEEKADGSAQPQKRTPHKDVGKNIFVLRALEYWKTLYMVLILKLSFKTCFLVPFLGR